MRKKKLICVLAALMLLPLLAGCAQGKVSDALDIMAGAVDDMKSLEATPEPESTPPPTPAETPAATPTPTPEPTPEPTPTPPPTGWIRPPPSGSETAPALCRRRDRYFRTRSAVSPSTSYENVYLEGAGRPVV